MRYVISSSLQTDTFYIWIPHWLLTIVIFNPKYWFCASNWNFTFSNHLGYFLQIISWQIIIEIKRSFHKWTIAIWWLMVWMSVITCVSYSFFEITIDDNEDSVKRIFIGEDLLVFHKCYFLKIVTVLWNQSITDIHEQREWKHKSWFFI